MAKADVDGGVFGDVLREDEAKKQGAGPRGASGGARRGPAEADADAFDAIARKDSDAEPAKRPSDGGGGGRMKIKGW